MFKSMLLSALLVGGVAVAEDSVQQPDTVSVPLSTAYIPGGFDSNDRAQVVVEGYFPNTCYRVGPYDKKMNASKKELAITQLAYKYRGVCLMMIVPFHQTVQLGILSADNYTVKDGNSNKLMGILPVQLASNSGPDDSLYASVNDAYLGVVDGSKRAIVIQGELPGDCWELKEKKTVLDGKNVITVMPVIEKVREANCNDYRMPFMTTVDLPQVEPGRYLLHVRSLNGQSINKLVDL
jgi:hypothetical protein